MKAITVVFSGDNINDYEVESKDGELNVSCSPDWVVVWEKAGTEPARDVCWIPTRSIAYIREG